MQARTQVVSKCPHPFLMPSPCPIDHTSCHFQLTCRNPQRHCGHNWSVHCIVPANRPPHWSAWATPKLCSWLSPVTQSVTMRLPAEHTPTALVDIAASRDHVCITCDRQPHVTHATSWLVTNLWTWPWGPTLILFNLFLLIVVLNFFIAPQCSYAYLSHSPLITVVCFPVPCSSSPPPSPPCGNRPSYRYPQPVPIAYVSCDPAVLVSIISSFSWVVFPQFDYHKSYPIEHWLGLLGFYLAHSTRSPTLGRSSKPHLFPWLNIH